MAPSTTLIADNPLHKVPISGLDEGSAGGVYHVRSRSCGPSRRRSTSSRPHAVFPDPFHIEEEGGEWREQGGKTKQVFRGRTLLWLAYQSIGVIYGDIGTSPLYVYSSTFKENPSYELLVQVLSVIIWSITIVVTAKYIFIILHADNEGEGGTFSCYSLLTRYTNISQRDPRYTGLVKIERHRTNDLKPSSRTLRSAIEKSRVTRGLLKTIGILAVSMVMADGVLTPAQSVLGAVQGLRVVKSSISDSVVVGTSCGILVLLFVIQPLGTTKIASTFAPIVIVWLGLNGSFGIYNLVKHDHSVLKAFNPAHAIRFFADNKTEGWKMLGGILLAFTGVEALFADLGAFSMRAIQLSWMFWAYPCLLLAYIGQAAFISETPDAYDNPFFKTVPPGMLYPSLVIAVLAAIVASQAMITATFQLTSQIMKLSYCPQVKVVHTSRIFHGQLYVPFLNWILMLGTIVVTTAYSNTTRLGNAYGVCVMFVTFFDTCMVTLVSLLVWRLSPFLVFLPWLIFACVDGLYLSSALNKVPDGAWFTITVAAILALIFLLWRFGKENQWRAEAEDRFRLSHLLGHNAGTGELVLTSRWGGDNISSIRGFGIFFDKAGILTPAVFTHFVAKLVAVPEVIVFFHLHPVEEPSVAEDKRYVVERVAATPACYRIVIRHGFMDEVISPDLAALIYGVLRGFVTKQASKYEAAAAQSNGDNGSHRQGSEKKPGDNVVAGSGPPELRDEKIAAELARLDRAYAAKIVYVVGKEQMHIREGTSLWRRIVLGTFLWIRDNTRAKIANLRLSMDRVVEVGFVKEI